MACVHLACRAVDEGTPRDRLFESWRAGNQFRMADAQRRLDGTRIAVALRSVPGCYVRAAGRSPPRYSSPRFGRAFAVSTALRSDTGRPRPAEPGWLHLRLEHHTYSRRECQQSAVLSPPFAARDRSP